MILNAIVLHKKNIDFHRLLLEVYPSVGLEFWLYLVWDQLIWKARVCGLGSADLEGACLWFGIS